MPSSVLVTRRSTHIAAECTVYKARAMFSTSHSLVLLFAVRSSHCTSPPLASSHSCLVRLPWLSPHALSAPSISRPPLPRASPLICQLRALLQCLKFSGTDMWLGVFTADLVSSATRARQSARPVSKKEQRSRLIDCNPPFEGLEAQKR